MVPSPPNTLDGLTDEQLAELEAQQGQPEITTGLMDRLSASPAPTAGFTDQQLDSLPVLASTPFAQERGIALPPEAPAAPEPMTDQELNQLEEENYRRVDYIMPEEEFRQYWTRRKEEDNEVGRFIEGVGQGAASMLGMIPQAGREIRDGMVGMVTDPVNQVQRNVQTGAEIVRKAGINMVQLFDWVGNKVNDVSTWARRRGLKQQALAKRLEQEGRLTGDELRDAEIIAAAASEADAMEPTPLEEEEDFDKAYERYQREKALEQEFAGVTDFQIGASKVSAPATTKDAYQITDEKPAETMSLIGSMAIDPVNLLPVGAGALSKLRVLRRTATLAGAPLRGLERLADATADLAERAEFGISSRVQDITGLTAKQQAALGAGAAGAAVYADQAGGGGNFTTAVTAIGSVLPGLRYGGAIIRKTGAAAGGAATIIREAGVGGIGTARAEAAADLSRMTAIPERYRKYFTGYVDGTDSTLKRVAQEAGNPDMLRRVARLADRAGVTTAARLADDVTSGAVAAGITGAPFAALQPDAERAGEVLGGIMALGGVAGAAGSAVRRGATEADADIARMMADVYAVGGNVDALSALPHGTLDRMAAMQGVLAGKVDFVPLKADEYRMNKDVSATGGELAAGLFLEKDANGRARVFINLDARKSAGGVEAIAPHEIGHAILTSNVLDGQPRNDLRNLVNQQYGPDGVTARGREYVGRLVDADIQNGTTGELPQVLTEQEFRDLESGNKSAADIAKGRKLEPAERERLINERFEQLSQQSISRGEDALDWARDEIIAETFASEAPAIDFRAIRRDAAFPRLAESMLAAGGRVLEMMGVRLDINTGKMLDNPSVLFRDNPLFQDRIMQKRVKEYVRAYDQYLVGLEEAGSATPRGVELARSSRPEDLGRSTHVKLRDEGRGVLENDFLFQKPDGTYSFKPQRIINAAEANRAAQIKTLYDAKKFVPVNSTEFGRRKVNGREVIGGPVLPPQFDLFTQFPQHVRQFARAMEASRAEGGSWNIDYNAIGTGSSGRYRITNMGAVRAIQRETVPFGWQVTKQNHLLAASLDLNAFRAAAMKAINKGELGIFNNDMRQVEADLKTYLANHRNGLPGEATIGQQKRDTLNGLIGTGTAVQRAANPLYAELNPKGSIRTWRIDRLNDAQPSGRTGYFFDYDKINNNRMPQQIPREAQGMPDAPASGRADGMLDAEYMAAVQRGDENAARKIMEEAIKPSLFFEHVSKGKVRPFWHHKRTAEDFTTFRTPAWFSKNKEYVRELKGPLAYKLSDLEASRPYFLTPDIIDRGPFKDHRVLSIDGVDLARTAWKGKTWEEKLPFIELPDRDQVYPFHDWQYGEGVLEQPGVLDAIKEQGYQIIHIKERGYDTYAVLDPSIIKTADAVLRDEAGNVIPPSQRFGKPSAAPRAQAMPDSLESIPTEQLQRQYEENQGYLGLSTLGMREGRPVRGGAAQTRELLRRNEAISTELERRGVRQEDPQLQRALQRRGQAMPDAGAQDAFEYAKRRHGTTRSIYEAGYVLPDGTMLDFSGKSDASGYERKPDGNFGPQSGQRDYLRDTRNSDHREIRFSESQDFGGSEAMTEFMRKGAVRVDANSGLISIHGRQRLTAAQKSVLKDIVRSQDGAWLDLEDDAGNRTSLELKSGKWAPVEGLLNQWADGKTPRPRAQFMPDDVNADAVGLRSAKFLEQAVGDGMENLRAKQAKREGTGVAKNKFVRFHDNQGRPIYIGAIKKDGGKSFAGWIEETEAWQTPEETAAYRQWYRELKGYFTEIFGDRAGEMMMAWLAAQQNVSPGGALGNVFKVEDRLAGIGTGKKGGLADGKIKGVLLGEVPEGGFGPKLTDFVDAGFLREYRTYMAKQPAGGRPFVADVHTGRDSGHVDQQTLTRLKQRADEGDLFIDGRPTRVKVLETKTVKQGNKTVIVPERIRVIPQGSKGFDVAVDMRGSPGGPKYEGISEWGNAMTDHLNKIGWRGGEWTPAEVQAVGWMRVLRQYGLPEPTVLSALQQNTSRIYAEVNYSSGNLLPANYPAFDSLAPDVQRAITMDVIEGAVNELAPIIGGSLRVQRVSAGTGAWGNMRSPTTVIEALGSAEATDLFGLALATVSEQAATMSATFGVGGKNSRALSFKKRSGEKFTDAEMQSIIDDAEISGYTMQQLPGGDTGLIADATKDFKPKGLTEARALQVLKRLLAWADKNGIDIEVRDVSARITSYGNNWKNNTDGQAYLSEIVRRGGAARVRDIVRFRGRYAEILREAYQRHAPKTVVPDAQEQVGPIRQAAEAPPLEILEMLRGA